jgi:glycosyltransferase involved in cell wall biosynthesis
MAKVEMRSLGIQCHKVINNGVDMQLFRPREKDNLRKKYGVPANALVACWVGSSHPIKGIQVISELILKYPEVYWILVFKGQPGPRGPLIPSSLAELVDRIRRTFVNVTKRRIMKLKQLQPQQLSKIYAMSDFCVLPYLCEGNSHAVLEACSSNLPLITTKTGLFWDFWDDRIGVAVDKSRDVQEYCDAIAKIRGDLSAFGPRSVISEQKLDLESWSDTWVKYLTQDIAPGLSRPTVR